VPTDVTSPSEPRPAGTRRPGYLTSLWQWLALLLVAGAALSWPAVWNRAPLVFFDSGSYLARADAAVKFISGQSPTLNPRATTPGAISADKLVDAHTERNGASRSISTNPFFWRPIFYSIWLAPFATKLSFWLIPFGQGLAAAYVMRRLLLTLGLKSVGVFAVCVGAVAAVSSLPWNVSYIMPDVFTGLLIGMSFVLVADWPKRSWAGRALDVVLLAAMVSVHLSHIPLTIGLIGVYAVGGLIVSRDRGAAIRAGGGVAGVVAALILAIAGLMGSNIVGAHKATLSESSPLFLMARLVGDGSAIDYLKGACPTRKYLVCDPQARVAGDPAKGSVGDYFLWSDDGPVQRLGSPQFLKEAGEINAATLKQYPGRELSAMASHSAQQFVTVHNDPAMIHPPPSMVVEAVDSVGPDVAKALMQSKQAKADFPLKTLNLIQDLGLAAALIGIGGVAIAGRNRVPSIGWKMAAVVGIGLLGNAMVTGGLSSVHDRYQNRVVWLVVFTAAALAALAWTSRERQTAA
jgi:hypothetical protein